MGRASEVDLRVELERPFYFPGETIRGTVLIRTTQPVNFKTAALVWQTHTKTIDSETGEEHRSTVLSIAQPIIELIKAPLDGEMVVPVLFEVPEDMPTSVELSLLEYVTVYTNLTVSLVMGAPLHAAIVRDYPIKIVRRSTQMAGILQSVEFPTRSLCLLSGTGEAHIELLETTFTAGDRMEATIVVDLTSSAVSIKGSSLLLKRTIIWRESRESATHIEEHELFEGPKTNKIHSRKKSAVTVTTRIPELSFAPDVETEIICIRHAALFFFYCGPDIIETEIPITLVHPEALSTEYT